MPTAYILVGVPASGKTTWCKSQNWVKDCVVASTDVYVEAFARHVGKSYSEVFDDVMKEAVKQMLEDVNKAVATEKDIIWDQTSTTVASRAKKIKMLDGYTKIAVVFKTPEESVLSKRLASRPGKIIPPHVMESMINSFEYPTLTEGFDQVWHA